jgi:excisionase family DNA binding protein
MTQPYYIRKDQAAELLSISQRTLNRYVATGHLTEYELPLGGHKRLKSAEVLALPRRTRRAL